MPYNPLKDEIFLPIPLKIAQRSDLSSLSKLVYGYLLKCFGNDGQIQIKAATIANDLKRPRQKISESISELNSKKLIETFRTGKASRYEFLPIPVVTPAVTSVVTPAVTSVVTPAVTSPLLKENKKRIFKKSVQPPKIQTKPSAESAKAAPDFLKKIELWNSIPIEIRRKLNKKQILTGSIEKIEYSIERMIVAMTSGGNAVAAFQNAFKGDHAKLTRKMEEIEMKKNREHTKDIDILFKKARDHQNIKFQPTDVEISKFVKEFRSVMSPMYDNHSDSAIICLRSFQSCLKNRVTS